MGAKTGDSGKRSFLRSIQAVSVFLTSLALAVGPGALRANAWQGYDCGGYTWPSPNCPDSPPELPDSGPDLGSVDHIDIDISVGSNFDTGPCKVSRTGANNGCAVVAPYFMWVASANCQSTVVYTDGSSDSGDCTFGSDDGTGGKGGMIQLTNPATVSGTGCLSFSYDLLGQDSELIFRDAAKPVPNYWRIVNASPTSYALEWDSTGWDVQLNSWLASTITMHGVAENQALSRSIDITLSGRIAGGPCLSFDVGQFSGDLHGTGVVS